MTWKYDSATQIDNTVRVRLSKLEDGVEINSRTFTWTLSPIADGELNQEMPELIEMIKVEIAAMLNELNATAESVDISREVKPDNV